MIHLRTQTILSMSPVTVTGDIKVSDKPPNDRVTGDIGDGVTL